MQMGSRKQAILERLHKKGEIQISDLAEHFGISEMTIRRDLESLEMDGFVRRIRGGAIPATSRSYEPPILTRESQNHEAKIRIGRAAAELLRDGETVILDVGTTVLQMARAINSRMPLTIVTSSLLIATELSSKPQVRTIVAGGEVRPGELSLIGASTENAFQNFNCDSFFIGVAGVSAANGLTEYNLDDSRVKKSAIKASARKIVLADSSKIGKVAFASVAELSEIDILITDANPINKEIDLIKDAGVEVIHVEPFEKEN